MNNCISLDNSKLKNKFYDIKYDIVFKRIFGTPGNEEYTKSLLEAILGVNINQIDIYQDINISRYMLDEKIGILDVMAVVNDDIIINIEMQRTNTGNMQKRSEKYAADIYSRVVKVGTKYENAKKVILINILNYKLNNHDEYISDTVTVLNLHRKEEIDTNIKYYFIELPKLKGKKLDLTNKLVQWLIYIYGKNKELIEVVKNKNNIIKEVDDKVKYLQGEEAEARMQELRNKWDYTIFLAVKDAKEKGEKRGEKRGEKYGEKRSKIKIAKKMFEENIPENKILEILGISKFELAQIISSK